MMAYGLPITRGSRLRMRALQGMLSTEVLFYPLLTSALNVTGLIRLSQYDC